MLRRPNATVRASNIPVAEWQAKSVRLHEQRQFFFARDLQHGNAKVRSDNDGSRGGLAQGPGQVSAAGCKVEDSHADRPRRQCARLSRAIRNLGHRLGDDWPGHSVSRSLRTCGRQNRDSVVEGWFRCRLSLSLKSDWKLEPCSREDSNLQGLPHALLRRTRLPVSPREQIERLQSLCCLRL